MQEKFVWTGTVQTTTLREQRTQLRMLTGELSLGNPFTPMISLLILLSVCHIIFMILVKEFGIGSTNIFLYSPFVCLVLCYYGKGCKGKFCLVTNSLG